MKLRYPCKIGDILYPKGTIVTPVELEEVQQVFKGINYSLGSVAVAVRLPDRKEYTILHESQIERMI
jgi:hypothetical protein